MRRDGFTIVELLVAAALLLVILGALGALYVSTTRAYRTNQEVTSAAAQMRSAVEAIQRDFSQAGFTGRSRTALGEPFGLDLGNQVCLTAADGEEQCGRNVETLRISYATDSEAGGLTQVAYTVEDDLLLQESGGGAPLPLAENIAGLDLLRYVRADGSTSADLSSRPADTRGLELRLRYLQGGQERSEEFTVVAQ